MHRERGLAAEARRDEGARIERRVLELAVDGCALAAVGSRAACEAKDGRRQAHLVERVEGRDRAVGPDVEGVARARAAAFGDVVGDDRAPSRERRARPRPPREALVERGVARVGVVVAAPDEAETRLVEDDLDAPRRCDRPPGVLARVIERERADRARLRAERHSTTERSSERRSTLRDLDLETVARPADRAPSDRDARRVAVADLDPPLGQRPGALAAVVDRDVHRTEVERARRSLRRSRPRVGGRKRIP